MSFGTAAIDLDCQLHKCGDFLPGDTDSGGRSSRIQWTDSKRVLDFGGEADGDAVSHEYGSRSSKIGFHTLRPMFTLPAFSISSLFMCVSTSVCEIVNHDITKAHSFNRSRCAGIIDLFG
jgi:hypothetical protein